MLFILKRYKLELKESAPLAEASIPSLILVKVAKIQHKIDITTPGSTVKCCYLCPASSTIRPINKHQHEKWGDNRKR